MCQFNLWVDIGNSSVDWEIGSCYDSVDIKDFQPSVIPQHHTSTIACVANHQLIQHFSNPTIVKPKSYKGLVFDYNLSFTLICV
jgi:hypothetical protein